MLRKRLLLPPLVALGLVLPVPVQGAAPASGIVVEGRSVPGVVLGDTRAEVDAAWGQPSACHDIELGGDLAYCSYPVDGGGNVSVRFRGPDGRYAKGAPDDVVYDLSWGYSTWWQAVPIDWTTTAGISASIALADRDAVVAAYPDAEVTYDSLGIASVVDAGLGISFTWGYDGYTHTTGVRIEIFKPRPVPPPDGTLMTVSGIDLSATKEQGTRRVLAVIRVLDEYGQPVGGARLSVTWTNPWGNSSTSTYNFTTETGYDFFEISDARHGTWTFTINDVSRDGYLFDRDGSVLSASIRVK